MAFHIVTGCGRGFVWPVASPPSLKLICPFKALASIVDAVGQIEAIERTQEACARCMFRQQPVSYSDGELEEGASGGGGGVGDQEPPSVGAAAPASGAVIGGGAVLEMPAVLEAGFVPVDGGLPLEDVKGDDPRPGQETPPLVDSAAEFGNLTALLTDEEKLHAAFAVDLDDDSPQMEIEPPTPPPTFESLLQEKCPWWRPGGSLMGWSKIKNAKVCRRYFFFDTVLGLRRKPTPKYNQEQDKEQVKALELGSLVHACLERFYATGDIDGAYEPIEAIKGAFPQLALEARRLVTFYLDRFNESEVREWDMRAVERESRYYFPARKCRGKKRSCCITSRLDGLYRQRRQGEGCLPPGVRADDGLRIHEIKTARSIGGRIRGFYMKPQLLLNLLTYNHGLLTNSKGEVMNVSLADVAGPCWTVTVSHLGKAKCQDPNKDLERTTFEIPEPRVLAFRDDVYDWYYEEILDRLFSPQKDDATTWPKDWLCEDVWFTGYTCPFVPLCEAESVDADLLYDQKGPLDRQLLELPKKLIKVAVTKKTATADVEAK